MKFGVFAYKTGSNSAKALASALGCKVVRHTGSKYHHYSTPGWWTVNWGADNCPSGTRVLNPSINLSKTRDKLKFFKLIKDYARVPDFTADPTVARSWFSNSKYVVCRETTTGHSGQGIVVTSKPEDVVAAPLYTRYVPKDSEYRLHFIAGSDTPFFVQRKARKAGFDGQYNTQVRNLAGGYVYVHEIENVGVVPPDVMTQGAAAFGHSGLDFGAIDVIYNKQSGKAYVLEVNSAPGLEGQTIQAYASAFQGLTK